jgi:hypothetical protein
MAPTAANPRSQIVGDGSFGYSPELPFHIYRARTGMALGAITAAGVALLWLIGVIMGNEVARSGLVVLAALAFVVPIAALLGFLACVRSPVVSLYDDRIELASAELPWRRVVLPREAIDAVRLDGVFWDGPEEGPRYARANVVFLVSPACFEELHRNRIWCSARDSQLHFPLENLERPQGDCYAMIEAYVLKGKPRQREIRGV